MDPAILYTMLTILVPLIGAFMIPAIKNLLKDKIHYYAIGIAVLTAVLSILAFIFGSIATADGLEIALMPWLTSINGIQLGLYIDRFALIMILLVANIGMMIVLFSHDYMKGDDSLPRYYFWILFFIGNMLGLVTSDNLLQLFIFWEGVGLCSYGLIGFWNKDDENVKSGTKAFLVTRAGDVALLAAIIIIFTVTGTMSFSELTSLGGTLANIKMLVPVGVLILIGIAGKSAQFPLQFWLPEAMAGPSTVSALIHAATMVKAGVFLGGRFLPFLMEDTIVPTAGLAEQLNVLFIIIAAVGVFTAFFAATIGMAAKEFKKILAFSTISQLGYMILAIGTAGLLNNSGSAFFASVFHMTSHMFFKALLFLGAGAILHAVVTTKNIFEMGGLRKYMPITTILFGVGALSLSGIPPFAGFFSKDTIFEYLIVLGEHNPIGIVFLVFAVLAAVMTFFYSMRMVGAVFFGAPSEKVKEAEQHGHLHDPGFFMLGPLIFLALGTTVWGFFGGMIENWMVGHNSHLVLHVLSNPWGWMILGIVLVVGGIPAYFFYFRKVSTEKIANSFFGKFFYNRWYWNKIVMTATVEGSQAIGDGLEYVEKGIDKSTDALGIATLAVASAAVKVDTKAVDGSVNGIAKGFQWIGQKLKKVETGFISQYIWIGVAGFVILLLVITLVLIFG